VSSTPTDRALAHCLLCLRDAAPDAHYCRRCAEQQLMRFIYRGRLMQAFGEVSIGIEQRIAWLALKTRYQAQQRTTA
jgi:hypothetical protein